MCRLCQGVIYFDSIMEGPQCLRHLCCDLGLCAQSIFSLTFTMLRTFSLTFTTLRMVSLTVSTLRTVSLIITIPRTVDEAWKSAMSYLILLIAMYLVRILRWKEENQMYTVCLPSVRFHLSSWKGTPAFDTIATKPSLCVVYYVCLLSWSALCEM